MEPEELINNLIDESKDLGEINTPPSAEYLIHNENRLHIRTNWNKDPSQLKGVSVLILNMKFKNCKYC